MLPPATLAPEQAARFGLDLDVLFLLELGLIVVLLLPPFIFLVLVPGLVASTVALFTLPFIFLVRGLPPSGEGRLPW